MKVAAYQTSNTEIIIAEDMGEYSGCREELNVRKLRTIKTMKTASAADTMRAIVARNSGYGMGWGDVGRLHPVSDEDIAALLAESAETERKVAAYHAAKAAEEAEIEAEERNASAVCQNCGTYCHGDCQA